MIDEKVGRIGRWIARLSGKRHRLEDVGVENQSGMDWVLVLICG